MLEPWIKLLTLDNMMKFIFCVELQTPTKVIVLSKTEEESLAIMP